MMTIIKINISLLLCLILSLSGCLQSDPQVKQKVINGATLIDVRTPDEFAEGSAKGAVNIPLNEVENRINEFRNKKDIVVFCRSGNRSGQAMKILVNNGIPNVTNGGGWKTIKEIQENNEN